MNPPVTDELGVLDVIEIYSYYDGPRLFSCRGSAGQVLLVVWVGGDVGSESWYVAPLTKREFRSLRFGELELRAAFERPEAGFVWFVRDRPKKRAEAVRIELSDIREDWLPDAGETLELGKPVHDQHGNILAIRPPDLVEMSAMEAIRHFFQLNRKVVVTTRQLEIAHEDTFFHWITNRAIHDLIDAGELVTEERELKSGAKTRLIWSRGLRYPRRTATRVLELVESYSTNAVGRELGYQGEMLAFQGFARRGFNFKGSEVKENGGNTWHDSKHNFDFIFERDGCGYGIEVKNTLGYMDHTELEIKIEMARQIGVRPVVVARMLPGTWIQELNKAGGFGLLLKHQLYPPALAPMAYEIRRELALPVDCPRFLAERTMDRFESWHVAQNGQRL